MESSDRGEAEGAPCIRCARGDEPAREDAVKVDLAKCSDRYCADWLLRKKGKEQDREGGALPGEELVIVLCM